MIPDSYQTRVEKERTGAAPEKKNTADQGRETISPKSDGFPAGNG
jgi:hypothetical protein